jgi:hypothetical protein
LIEFIERRRNSGRFSSYLYRVLHIVRTTGHGRRVRKGGPIYKRTKRSVTPPNSPPTQGYSWLFGKDGDPLVEEEHKRERTERRSRESERRKDGYGWLFE